MNNKNNQSHFMLQIADNSAVDIQIIGFSTEKYSLDNDEMITQNYSFRITCYNKSQSLLQELINKKAVLIMYDHLGKIYHHGIITHCTDHQKQNIADEIIIHSPLYLLTLNIRRRVYHNVTLPALIEQILSNNGWQYYEYQLLLDNVYPMREYVVQYQESDFEFLHRKCAFYGVFFSFIQLEHSAVLVFYDNINNLTGKTDKLVLSYVPENGEASNINRVFHIEWQQNMITDNIILNDYNYRSPEISLFLEGEPSITQQLPRVTHYRFQDHYKTLAEGEFLLQIRQEALVCRRTIWTAKTNCNILQLGFLIEINNHPITSMNGHFVVISITQQGDQSAQFPTIINNHTTLQQSYFNIIELIPVNVPYRPKMPEPIYQENCLANINGTPGNYADIDQYGRYLIRPKFDNSIAPNEQTSHRVRFAQALVGNQYGAHFPLHVGTEVLLTHLNGDPDRPIIIGVLPNMNGLSPVTANNFTQNILSSWGGNQLLFDDQLGHEHILLSTSYQQNYLLLDATYGLQQIKMCSLQGDINFQAGTTITSRTQNNLEQIVDNNHMVTVQNQAQIITQNGDININAATNLQFYATNNITLETIKENIILQSDNDLNINANDDINIAIPNGDLIIQTNNGDLTLNAAQDILLQCTGSFDQIYIAQGGISIQISQQSITLNSSTAIQFSAEQININGNVNYGKNNIGEMSTNLILHYQDEIGEKLNNIDGIYQLFPNKSSQL